MLLVFVNDFSSTEATLRCFIINIVVLNKMVFIIKGNNKDIEHKYILRTPKERFKNLKSQKV